MASSNFFKSAVEPLYSGHHQGMKFKMVAFGCLISGVRDSVKWPSIEHVRCRVAFMRGSIV